MKLEDIKKGETYNVRVRVARIDTNRFVCQPLNQDGTPSDFCPNYFNFAEAEAFYPAENGMKNTETAPKYNPNRKFKRGDKVQIVREYRGRVPNIIDRQYFYPGKVYTVATSEGGIGGVLIHDDDSHQHAFYFWELELVATIEELEPYHVAESWCNFNVEDAKGRIVSSYSKEYHPHAEAKAKDECNSLNAQHGKEMEK